MSVDDFVESVPSFNVCVILVVRIVPQAPLSPEPSCFPPPLFFQRKNFSTINYIEIISPKEIMYV